MPSRDYFEKDYYAVLGVPKDADQATISKAYRRLARENHPDAKPGDAQAEARFKEISEAHAVLSNADKRKEYDQVREMVGSGGFAGFPGGGAGGFGGATAGGFDLGDIIGQVFGRGAGGGGFGRRSRATRGGDVETTVRISFEDSISGATVTLPVSGPAPCATCGGSGAAPGTSPITCPVCNGAGVVARNQGLFSFSEPCTACGGTGRQIPTPCPTCAGSGTQIRRREVRARIPAGVKDGARIRVAGKGEAGSFGAEAGDLYVVVHVDAHPIFGRRDDNLTVRVPITFAEAALGTRITVPTLDEPVTVKIPAGTESGRTFRVRGKGVRTQRGAGDLLVTVELVVPRRLTKTQRKALQAFADLDDSDPRAELDSYIQRTAAASEAV